MQAAADAGLAPRVRYASAEDRISIADFVEAVPLPTPDALVRIPGALRALHALPPFPGSPFNTTCTFLLNTFQLVEKSHARPGRLAIGRRLATVGNPPHMKTAVFHLLLQTGGPFQPATKGDRLPHQVGLGILTVQA